jgi:hypothetical protein
MMVAALMVNAPIAAAQPAPAQPAPAQPAPAQSPEQQAKIRAGIDEAIKALGHSPSTKKMSPQKKKELVEFIVGNILFVLAHEMGHIVINELDLPVLGKEEDAADSFAVTLALHLQSTFSERVLLEAAKGWVLSSYRDKKERARPAFYDEHGLDLQRAYGVVCMMVGSDPEKYKTLAEETKLPEERQKSCVRDYKNAVYSWEKALKPHIRPADQPKTVIKVEYKDSKDYAHQAAILRQMGVLEAFAGRAADRFVWPRPFSFETRECGEPNAKWFLGTQTMVLCYELAEEFIELFQGYSRKLPRKIRAAR